MARPIAWKVYPDGQIFHAIGRKKKGRRKKKKGKTERKEKGKREKEEKGKIKEGY